jgi:hypothetical protein
MAYAITRHLDRGALARWFIAGNAWGLTLAAFLLARNMQACGLPCPDDAAFLTALCVGTGLLTIGPFAAFAPRARNTEPA